MTNNTVPQQTEDGDSEFTLRLSSDAEMKFRRIAACPAGFLMGSRNRDANEEPAHRVVITEEFGDRSEASYRVLRGGSYWDTAIRCRSACHSWDGAGVRYGSIGFRVCLVRSPLFSQTGEAEPERTALERRDEATGPGVTAKRRRPFFLRKTFQGL